MAEYSNLSATINAQIRANGVQAITGPVLNAVLTAMVNVLGDGYRLKGVAVPADNPGSPDNRVAYLAAQDGTYANFGGLAVSGEVALLLWDSAWTKATLFSIDTAVTPGSGNLVTSGAVDSALTTLANNIAAAYMQLVPGATEGNLAEFDNAGQVRDAGLATSDLAKKDGHYADLFAGFAGNLVDTRSAGTPQGPFAFRQSGGDGVNYMRKILGKTEAWNQSVVDQMVIGSSENQWSSYDASTSLSISDNVMTLTKTGGLGIAKYKLVSGTIISGHKYFMSTFIKTSAPANSVTISAYAVDTVIDDTRIGNIASSNWQQICAIMGCETASQQEIRITNGEGSDYHPVDIKQYMFVDLTLMFGAGNEPSTVAELEALHPLPYYNYNAGVLKNNAATGLETTGFNQWDEEWESGGFAINGEKDAATDKMRSKNFIPVIGGNDYYFRLYAASNGVLFYDANYNLISRSTYVDNGIRTAPVDAAWAMFFNGAGYGTTYNHDICINRSDASRNGTYEPYWKREIVLGLGNLPCHDENNNAVVVNGLDGVGTAQDELIVENGWGTKINKRRKRVNLGDLTWTKSTSGGHDFFFSGVVSEIKQTSSGVANLICPKYTTSNAQAADLFSKDKQIGESTGRLYVYDTALSGGDAAAFKAAMAGVYADVELATPKVLTLDNPIPALIEVDNLGTEKRLPEDTADNPQGPFECDSNYSVSTANLVRLLNL